MALLLFLAVLSLLCLSLSFVLAQNYYPQVPALTSSVCLSQGGSYISFGNNSIQSYPNAGSLYTWGWYIMTQFFNNTAFGVNITQLSIGLGDNTATITDSINIRLALYEVLAGQSSMYLLGQTNEITVFPSGPEIIYAALQTSVMLEGGLYAITLWSSADSLVTGYKDAPSDTFNSAWGYYYYAGPYGYPGTTTLEMSNPSPALAAHGCQATTGSPYLAANTNVYEFCAFEQTTIPPTQPKNNFYAVSTMTATIGGFIAVSTLGTGTNSYGSYSQVTAGYGLYYRTTSSALYYHSWMGSEVHDIPVTLGTTAFYTSASQYVYPSANANTAGYVDANGLSFKASDGSGLQFIITYNSSSKTYQLLSSVAQSFTPVLSGFTLAPINPLNGLASFTPCQAPQLIQQDSVTVTCPGGSTMVTVGDVNLNDAMGTYYGVEDGADIYANVYQFRPFTVITANTILYQLSWLIAANPNQIIHARLGLFNSSSGIGSSGSCPALSSSPYSSSPVPPLTLLSQTNELVIANSLDSIITANLLQPVSLILGQQYYIGLIVDSAAYTSVGYWSWSGGLWASATYSLAMANGFPSSLVPNYWSPILPLGGVGCASQTTTTQFAFCAAFTDFSSENVTYKGVVTALVPNTAVTGVNGQYYTIIGGSGFRNETSLSGDTYCYNTIWWGAPCTAIPFTVDSWSLPTNNRIYYNNHSYYLDSAGLQLVVDMGITSYGDGYAVQIANNGQAGQYNENIDLNWFGGYIYADYWTASTFVLVPYTTGTAIPDCYAGTSSARPSIANNYYPSDSFSCSGNMMIPAPEIGDSNTADYARHSNNLLFSAVQGMVYTKTVTVNSDTSFSYINVGLLDNTATPGYVYLCAGIYQVSNGALIATTDLTNMYISQTYARTLTVPFNTPVTLLAGVQYYLAITASAPINIASDTSSTSPIMTTASFQYRLPSVFNTTSRGVSPSIGLPTCQSATHFFCALIQYDTLGENGAGTAYIYEGLILAGSNPQSNSYGTYLPIMNSFGHMTIYSRSNSYPIMNTYSYSLNSISGNIYTTSQTGRPLDTSGIRISVLDNHVRPASSYNTTISYNSSSQQYQDSSVGYGCLGGTYFTAVSITALTANSIPQCSISQIPYQTSGLASALQCPSGSSQVIYGDASEMDINFDIPGDTYMPNDELNVKPFTSPSTPSIIYQISFGVGQNYDTIARLSMAIYDNNLILLGFTNELILYNSGNQILTATLNQSVYLAPNTNYYLTVWSDTALWAGFGWDETPAMDTPYIAGGGAAAWPAVFVNNAYGSSRALGGYGCTTAMRYPLSSSSTGNANNQQVSGGGGDSSNLSKGGVAGVVIGCVIGSNLLLLCCIFYCFGAAFANSRREEDKKTTSELEPSQSARTSQSTNLELQPKSTTTNV